MNALDTTIGPDSAMPGTMMDVDLTIAWAFEHVLRNNASRAVVSRLDDGTLHRYTYADFGTRVAQLAHALVELGIRPGDRVASFAWNTHRHLELYYAVPMIGAVLHTVNIRLFPEQVCWIFDHADDKLIFVDASLAKSVAIATATRPEKKRSFVVMGRSDDLPGALDYETLIAGRPQTYAWPDIAERTAALLCYTSATTGDPKGVVFTHRSLMLHALAGGLGDCLNVLQRDTMMPVVPMFHVAAWGFPYLAPMMGAALVLPGPKLDAKSLVELIEGESVTLSAGVPTVWLGVRDELVATGKTLPTLRMVICGGAAIPPSLFDDMHARGTFMQHAWGMTEMSPIGTNATVSGALVGRPWSEQREQLLKQGRFSPIVAWKLLDDDGNEVPHDGKTPGALWVRGPAVTGAYFNVAEQPPVFAGGYFCTGDVATVDDLGYLTIVDRSKDLVKSGGEWISSVDLENMLMGHPAIREAAVIGLPHAKWGERPVAVVAMRDGRTAAESEIQAWIGERIAKWMIPDRIIFVETIPRTGVGKFLKRQLREEYADLLQAAGD
jgi:fatty-acyl-CoA synthase